EMRKIAVCRDSGQRRGRYCPNIEDRYVPLRGLETPACAYHRMVHVSVDERYQQHRDCAPSSNLKSKAWFVLPPVQEHYYRKKHLSYKPLPPYAPGCVPAASVLPMALVYPQPRARI